MDAHHDSKSYGCEVITGVEMMQSNSSTISSVPDFSFKEDADLDVRLDRCILLAQDLLKEAERALNEPRTPLLLTQGACRAQMRSVTDTKVSTTTAGAVLARSLCTEKKAVDLLRTQTAVVAPLPSSKAS
jgi:hypothetical protein